MFVPLRYETPDVTVARLIEKALVCNDLDYRRADAFSMIKRLIDGADRLARRVFVLSPSQFRPVRP